MNILVDYAGQALHGQAEIDIGGVFAGVLSQVLYAAQARSCRRIGVLSQPLLCRIVRAQIDG